MSTTLLPEATIIKGLKGKNYQVAGDLIIDGDLDISDTLVVGGDLLVKGNCEVRKLHCLGHVTVEGNFGFGEARVLGGLDCDAHCSGDSLVAIEDADADAILLGVKANAMLNRVRNYYARRVASSVSIREQNANIRSGGDTVNVKGDLTLAHAEIHGGLDVSGSFRFRTAKIFGSSSIGGSLVGKDIEMTGSAHIGREINVRKRLMSWGDLSCWWHCRGGEIEVRGDLDARHAITATGSIVTEGHIISGNRIQVRGKLHAGKSIQSASSIFAGDSVAAGKKYGIHAGLSVSKEELRQHGFIACPTKPRRIVSGVHVKDRHYQKLNHSQRISWPAFDGADFINHQA